ncbi:MAG TPA: Trp family transcriptional regulator [Xanthomonadales bacterium]|nr:Trp family transcriptional regulator [Xanthomonadales bacterium]
MPRASKRILNKNIYEELEDHFSFLISSLHSSQDIERFFSDFLTSEEKSMLTKRLMLHLMLENGYTVSHIKAVLNMSRETIRVHQHVWGKGGNTYKVMLQKIAHREKTKEFWKKVEQILRPFDLALQSKTNMKARAKIAGKDYQ